MSLSVDIYKNFGSFVLDVAFEVTEEHEVLALLGPSGCGKSLTLKCIAGIVTPDRGRIVLNDRVLFDSKQHINLTPQKRRVGYLFQNYALFPSMTVYKNVLTGCREGTKTEKDQQVTDLLVRFQLTGLENQKPAQLSGGQQQRCALARIFANRPELLLLDEPFSALDEYLRWQLELELADTFANYRVGTVFVSHNRNEVQRLCDTVCVITKGTSEPKIPVHELFEAPRTISAAKISGCKNYAQITQQDEQGRLWAKEWGVWLTSSSSRLQDMRLGSNTLGSDTVCLDTTASNNAAAHTIGIRAHYFHACELDANEHNDRDERNAHNAHNERKARKAPDGHNEHKDRDEYGEHKDRDEYQASCENLIECEIERVVIDVFETSFMLKTPGGGMIRYELSKTDAEKIKDLGKLTLYVDPRDVMILS